MRLLIRIILCAITLLGSALLFFSGSDLISSRHGVVNAAKYGLTASWSDLLMTSFAFIGGAPLVPLWGLLKAWRLRRNAQHSLWALLASALAAILLLVFRISREPAEWFLADGCG